MDLQTILVLLGCFSVSAEELMVDVEKNSTLTEKSVKESTSSFLAESSEATTADVIPPTKITPSTTHKMQNTSQSPPINSSQCASVTVTSTSTQIQTVTETARQLTTQTVTLTQQVTLTPTRTLTVTAACSSHFHLQDGTLATPNSTRTEAQTISWTTRETNASSSSDPLHSTSFTSCPPLSVNRSKEEMEEAMVSLVSELSVNLSSVSKRRRRKESAEDDRPSAKTLGVSAGIILVTAFLLVLLLDLPALHRDMRRVARRCRLP